MALSPCHHGQYTVRTVCGTRATRQTQDLCVIAGRGMAIRLATKINALTRDKRKPQTSHGGRVRCKPESGIQVRKGCLMSLTVLHETVLHVAQMRPESWN